jgi:dipeptidyl-peptidase-4
VVSGGTDPVERRLYRVPLDPAQGHPVPLTPGRGVFDVASTGRGDRFAYSGETLNESLRWEVADRTGPIGVRLRSVAEDPGLEPNLEITAVGDDPTYSVAIIRPREFDPERRYPVIVDVYGGPHYLQVQDRPSRYLLDQWMADRGYFVVAADGRGTPYRGRAWERAIKGDLGTLALHDQVAALRLLFARYPELDSTRVGITGWSFGGTMSALAALVMPGLFRAGAAGAPVTDWRDYDTHYTERYMGLPADNPEGYKRAAVLSHVGERSSPLLIVHGTSDDNVYFLNSLKLTQALFRAGRPFEFVPLIGFTHMVPDPVVTERLYARIMDFFDEHVGAARAGSFSSGSLR